MGNYFDYKPEYSANVQHSVQGCGVLVKGNDSPGFAGIDTVKNSGWSSKQRVS